MDGQIYLKILRIRVEVESFESAKKNLRIQKYPDTCGRDVSVPSDADGHYVYSVTRVIPDNNAHNSKFRNDINAFRNRCILTN